MKFHLAINMERTTNTTDMNMVRQHTIGMVQLADAHGFETAWAAEHHALEMTIAPNPFQILTWWGCETDRIRLGCGVANAAYWHPINLAGEAALLDLISGGRLELGLGSGAYQREFDRMKPGLAQTDSWQYMQEMLPLVRELWKGDVEHNGRFWQFPKATACPKPVQKQVPFWVAARAPITYDYAVANRCNVLSWPLTKDFAEAELYKARLDDAIGKAGGDFKPAFAIMRHSAVYDNEADRQAVLGAIRRNLSQFGNLMNKSGDVINGFPEEVPLEKLHGNVFVDPDMLEENLMFGSPETVIAKLRKYQDLGVDCFIYYASMGLDQAVQKRSFKLFVDEVMPAFQGNEAAPAASAPQPEAVA
jgi:alkanesulfonate monooxygenase SsuD/methylene tetrahydromethanopterin reductase-like flavin-dependent oxidoreductase (luciferase family)